MCISKVIESQGNKDTTLQHFLTAAQQNHPVLVFPETFLLVGRHRHLILFPVLNHFLHVRNTLFQVCHWWTIAEPKKSK
jgi:predicted amidohydrolase